MGVLMMVAVQSLSLIVKLELPNRYRAGTFGNRYHSSLS